VRLGDRLSVRWDVAADVERALVPNLILQPIVENALKHSIMVRSNGGKIRVSASRHNGSLHLEVEDDGDGLPPGFSIDDARGVGLRNLRDRLTAFFGTTGHLEMKNIPAGGLLVVIELPFREHDEAAPSLARTG